MGWASGSEVAEDIWGLVRPLTTKENRKYVAKKMIGIFENHDCDTIYECEQLYKDAGRNPDED